MGRISDAIKALSVKLAGGSESGENIADTVKYINDHIDVSAVGLAVLGANDAAAARTAIGAGTSSLAIGTTSTTAKAGDYAPAVATTSAVGTVKMAAVVADSTATEVAGLVTDFNGLLAALRTAGIIASA